MGEGGNRNSRALPVIWYVRCVDMIDIAAAEGRTLLDEDKEAIDAKFIGGIDELTKVLNFNTASSPAGHRSSWMSQRAQNNRSSSGIRTADNRTRMPSSQSGQNNRNSSGTRPADIRTRMSSSQSGQNNRSSSGTRPADIRTRMPQFNDTGNGKDKR